MALAFQRLVRPSASPAMQHLQEVREFVESTYVREVDEQELVEGALHGMVESLDAYSRYYGSEGLSAMNRETSGHYRGIGVVFARRVREAQVLFSLPDSPAARAGIGVGDRFLEVDGRAVSELSDGELQRLIGAGDATALRLRVVTRAGEEREVLVERADLVDPTVRHASILDAERGVGYLAITSYSQESPKEFDAAVSALERQGLEALVVDVRGNLGGVLLSAVTLTNRFVRAGLIVSQEGRGKPVRHEAKESEAWYAGMPLVVLIDGDSASASEVFAAALQEHRAAVLVGSASYGKGLVQQVRKFDGKAAVKLTNAYYYTPSHRNLERTVDKAWEQGIVPDLEVPLAELEKRRVHQHLAAYGPPPDALARIRDWEREEGLTLIQPRPPDAQLDAALALLRGERPGASVAEDGR